MVEALTPEQNKTGNDNDAGDNANEIAFSTPEEKKQAAQSDNQTPLSSEFENGLRPAQYSESPDITQIKNLDTDPKETLKFISHDVQADKGKTEVPGMLGKQPFMTTENR